MTGAVMGLSPWTSWSRQWLDNVIGRHCQSIPGLPAVLCSVVEARIVRAGSHWHGTLTGSLLQCPRGCKPVEQGARFINEFSRDLHPRTSSSIV
ncbi:MAG: hypothetical protein R3C97_16460 [Geminicoccaceae bacterium]